MILASASPRRRELLGLLGLDFEVRPSEVEELREGPPHGVVVENARRKARAAARPGEVVLGADTDVQLGDRLLGKAAGGAEARAHIEALSGREHVVLGGVVLISDGHELAELIRTRVRFRELSRTEIDAYIASDEWRDRAGAYAVQGLGASLVEGVDGDLSNVIGLPIPTVCRMIEELQDRE